MDSKKRHIHSHHRKNLKWAVKNNLAFFIIAGIICIIIGLIFGMEAFNYERVKSVESLLGKNLHTMHRVTGMTDEDVEKLRKEHPNFNWEGTWDRDRWVRGHEEMRETRSKHRAKEKYKIREGKREQELAKQKGY